MNAVGAISTTVFALSTLPMLLKAARTKDLSSYSFGNIVLANTGNAIHSIYVFHLPAGPVWVLHSFYVVTSGLMLFWYLLYTPRRGMRSITQSRPRPSLGDSPEAAAPVRA